MEEVKRQRNSFVDMGLVVALSVFVCVLIHGLLFGMTWIGMLWMGLAVAYVVMVCWLKRGHGKMKLMVEMPVLVSQPEVSDSVAADMSDGGEVAADSMSVDKGENEVEDMERSDTLSNKV